MSARNLALAVPLGLVLAVAAHASEVDFEFISKAEGGRRADFYLVSNSDNSGVTVATGLDLGQHDEAWLKGIGLTPEQYRELQPLLAPFLGKPNDPLNGERARAALDAAKREGKPVVLTETQAKTLDEAVWKATERSLKQEYEAAVAKCLSEKYPDHTRAPGHMGWDNLPSEAKTVLFSVKHQYGGLSQMRFWQHAVERDWKAAVRELWNFEDDFEPRRFAEGDLLRKLAPDLPAIQHSVGRREKGAVNDPADVKVVQQLLKDRGLYAGAISGTCNAETVAAVEAFQTSMEFEHPDGLVEPAETVPPGHGRQGIKRTFRLLVAKPPGHKWFFTLRTQESYLRLETSWADGSEDKVFQKEGEEATFQATCSHEFPFSVVVTLDVTLRKSAEPARPLTEARVVDTPTNRDIEVLPKEKEKVTWVIRSVSPGPWKGRVETRTTRVLYPSGIKVVFLGDEMPLLSREQGRRWSGEYDRCGKLLGPLMPNLPKYYDSERGTRDFDRLKSTVEERFHPAIVLNFAWWSGLNYELYLSAKTRKFAPRLDHPVLRWTGAALKADLAREQPAFKEMDAFLKLLSKATDDLAQGLADRAPAIDRQKEHPGILNLVARALNQFGLYHPRNAGDHRWQSHAEFFVNDFASLAFNYRGFRSKSANGIVDHLRSSEDWMAIHDPEKNRGLANLSFEKRLEKAQQLANEGYFVVIGWKNTQRKDDCKDKTEDELKSVPDPYQPGQLAIVISGPDPKSRRFTEPSVAYAGMPLPDISDASPFTGKPLHDAFGKDKDDKLVIYAYQADSRSR